MKRIAISSSAAILFSAAVLATPSATARGHAGKNLVETAVEAGSFQTLVRAVEAAGLAEALSGEGPFTVFAPTEAAFAALPKGALAGLLEPEARGRLVEVLGFHVVRGRLGLGALLERGEVETLRGRTLTVAFEDGYVRVGPARLLTAGLACSNGVIHVIDKVLLPPARERVSEPHDVVRLAIERGVPLFNRGHADACAAVYELAMQGLLAAGGTALAADEREILAGALDEAGSLRDAKERAWALRRAFDRLLAGDRARTARADAVAFEPLVEAPLPDGFPAPGPVGEVVVKRYPRYRAARTPGGLTAFGTLFNHIKRNRIEMTAPVEMGMEERGDDALSMRSMAFLYASTGLGSAGRDGRVEVLDLEPADVMSVGIRGPLEQAAVAAARRMIEARLAEDARWQRAGEWRLLGYNSPMIPAERRFWELQLPIEAP